MAVTVRMRLALIYGSMFLACGAGLLALTYALVAHSLGEPPVRISDTPDISRLGGPAPVVRSLDEAEPLLLSEVLHRLLVNFGLALAVLTVLAFGLGWLVAGRVLRPLREITASVRDISATDLHRRLALRRPDDELKDLGDTFDGLLARLESAFRSQRQFVANASHELRTPLARQRVLGQDALEDPEATIDMLRTAHERILAAGVQQERLIEAMLTLSRGQAGIEVVEAFDLAELVREVLETRQSEADERAVALRSTLTPAIVAGHRQLTERLVTNLVENALRHNGAEGWAEVTTRGGRRAVLTVVNTGPPVPPDEVDGLFVPFYRLSGARPALGDGLGLGLCIVRAIADAHDATVAVAARPEGGLVVEATFPATPVSAPSRPPSSAPSRDSPPGMSGLPSRTADPARPPVAP